MGKRKSVSMDAFMGKYAGVYYTKLLPRKPVEGRALATREQLLKRFNEVGDVIEQEGMHSYTLYNHKMTYKDDMKVPSQLSIAQVTAFDKTTIPELVLQRYRSYENIEELFRDCRYEIMFSDFMTNGSPVRERCEILAAFADIMMEIYPETVAMYWPHARKIVPRADQLNGSWSNPALHFLDGGVNARLFGTTESSGKIVDTTGLTAIGLCDLQCYFHNLDIDFIIHYMSNFTSYLYAQGEDIIKDGDTTDGRNSQERWHCQHEDTLVSPNRVVIDMNPDELGAGECVEQMEA